MARRTLALVAPLALRCIAPSPLRRPPDAPRVLAVRSPTNDLDALGRVPSLAVRFDRPMAWPAEGALLLVRGASTDALRGDASDGALTATAAQRAVPARLARDPRDPAVLTADAASPLLPDEALTLLVTPLARSADGAPLAAPDAGPRALAFPLTVAPARRCGALAVVEPVAPGDAPRSVARLHVRFDRPVRGARAEQPLALRTDAGVSVPARSSLDCLDGEGYARCAWVEPSSLLAPLAVYRVAAGDLRARNGAPVEAVLGSLVTGERAEAERVAFGPAPACAPGESSMGSFCVRTNDRWIELRASTTAPAILRLTARAAAGSRVAIGTSGTLHAARVFVPAPSTAYALTVEALGADGRPHDVRTLAAVTTAPALPRVRITEVVVRPRSTSAQEYVELVNEGPAAVSLAGYVLAQGVSRSALPEGASLGPGRRALVVGPAFDPRGDPRAGDPPATPGAAVIVLRSAVAGRGLRDSGADVALTDPTGRVLSFMPGGDPARPPREGVGLVRADTELADEDPAAWAYDALGGATPGAPDRVR